MTRKAPFSEGWSWFKLNNLGFKFINLGVALDTKLKFYVSVLGANSYVFKSYSGKTGRKGLSTTRPLSIQNMVKVTFTQEILKTTCNEPFPSWLGLKSDLLKTLKKNYLQWNKNSQLTFNKNQQMSFFWNLSSIKGNFAKYAYVKRK